MAVGASLFQRTAVGGLVTGGAQSGRINRGHVMPGAGRDDGSDPVDSDLFMATLAGLVDVAGAGVAAIATVELSLGVLEEMVTAGIVAAGGGMTVGAGSRWRNPKVAIGTGSTAGAGGGVMGCRRRRFGAGGGMTGGAGTGGCAHAAVAHATVSAGGRGGVVVFGLDIAPVDRIFMAEDAVFRRWRHDLHLNRAIDKDIVEDVTDRAVSAAGAAEALENRVLGDDVAAVMPGAGSR